MSLDVYLEVDTPRKRTRGSGIFVRENGATIEISREEWDRRHPDREPVISMPPRDEEDFIVYSRNITHNLNTMADEAGIYAALWRPDENGIEHARQLIEPLTEGLTLLRSDPARFKKFNPKNGWGDYEGLVAFVESYLDACRKHPDSKVTVSR